MDLPIRPKPCNAHKPRIRINCPGPGYLATYSVHDKNGARILLGSYLPDVYDVVVAMHYTEQAA